MVPVDLHWQTTSMRLTYFDGPWPLSPQVIRYRDHDKDHQNHILGSLLLAHSFASTIRVHIPMASVQSSLPPRVPDTMNPFFGLVFQCPCLFYGYYSTGLHRQSRRVIPIRCTDSKPGFEQRRYNVQMRCRCSCRRGMMTAAGRCGRLDRIKGHILRSGGHQIRSEMFFFSFGVSSLP